MSILHTRRIGKSPKTDPLQQRVHQGKTSSRIGLRFAYVEVMRLRTEFDIKLRWWGGREPKRFLKRARM